MVIADEADRSQYDFGDGYARHMRDALPKASFIGFTGAPIEFTGRQNALRVSATTSACTTFSARRGSRCPSTTRAAWPSSLRTKQARPNIDPDFQEATEGEEGERKERLKTR